MKRLSLTILAATACYGAAIFVPGPCIQNPAEAGGVLGVECSGTLSGPFDSSPKVIEWSGVGLGSFDSDLGTYFISALVHSPDPLDVIMFRAAYEFSGVEGQVNVGDFATGLSLTGATDTFLILLPVGDPFTAWRLWFELKDGGAGNSITSVDLTLGINPIVDIGGGGGIAPEPGSAVLAALAIGGLIARRCHTKSRSHRPALQ